MKFGDWAGWYRGRKLRGLLTAPTKDSVCLRHDPWNRVFHGCPKNLRIDSEVIMRQHVAGSVRLFSLKLGEIGDDCRVRLNRPIRRLSNCFNASTNGILRFLLAEELFTRHVGDMAPARPNGRYLAGIDRSFGFPSQRPQILGNPRGQARAERPRCGNVDPDTEQSFQFELQSGQVVQRRFIRRFNQQIKVAPLKIVATSNRSKNTRVADRISGDDRPNPIRVRSNRNRRTHVRYLNHSCCFLAQRQVRWQPLMFLAGAAPPAPGSARAAPGNRPRGIPRACAPCRRPVRFRTASSRRRRPRIPNPRSPR
jgi:hypothetical protein